MCLFIFIGLILVLIGFIMLLANWATWPTGVTLIVVGLAVVVLFGGAYKKVFTDKVK
jgi:uncharacterized membrane protein